MSLDFSLPPTGPADALPGLFGTALGLIVAGLLAVVLAARRVEKRR